MIVEAYYEIIKDLATALLYREGGKAIDHVALITYLEERSLLPRQDIVLVDQLRRLRNDISYKGLAIDPSFVRRNRKRIEAVIERLSKTIGEGLGKAAY